MGVHQAAEPLLDKVSVRPTLIARQASAIPPVAFQEQSSQATTDGAVVIPEDAPMAMAEVIEPALRRAIESPENDGQRVARLAGSQVADAVGELLIAPRPRKAQL